MIIIIKFYILVMKTLFAEGFVKQLPGSYTISNTNIEQLVGIIVFYIEQIYGNQPITLMQTTDMFDCVLQALMGDIATDYIEASAIITFSQLHIYCIRNSLIDQYINQTVKANIVNTLYDLSVILNLVDSITKFYNEDLVPSLVKISLSDDCVNGFISLQCGACMQTIPDLCHGVCEQLVQGCYSSHRRGLINELNILWNVTEQLVEIIESKVGQVLQLIENPIDLVTLDFENTAAMRSFVSSKQLRLS